MHFSSPKQHIFLEVSDPTTAEGTGDVYVTDPTTANEGPEAPGTTLRRVVPGASGLPPCPELGPGETTTTGPNLCDPDAQIGPGPDPDAAPAPAPATATDVPPVPMPPDGQSVMPLVVERKRRQRRQRRQRRHRRQRRQRRH